MGTGNDEFKQGVKLLPEGCQAKASALKILKDRLPGVPFDRRIPIGTAILQDTHQARPSV
jgi:hypothetical protein